MIDSLFGSRTRVKLLHLFLNNPGRSFYVREITRTIDEQINSVRRELSNMLNIGIINSHNSDNKLYYEINQEYQFYDPLCQIFSNKKIKKNATVTRHKPEVDLGSDWDVDPMFSSIPGLKVAIMSGVFVSRSVSELDLLLSGNVDILRVKRLISKVESKLGAEIRYTIMTYDDFYYRLSVRDVFLTDILSDKYRILVDTENILGQHSGR